MKIVTQQGVAERLAEAAPLLHEHVRVHKKYEINLLQDIQKITYSFT